MNQVGSSFNPYKLTSSELGLMIESCTHQFERMKKENESLFQESPWISEMDSQAVFEITEDIDMDDENVFVVSVEECPYLGTSGLATCFAVASRGVTKEDEIYIGLAHINLIPPKEVLEGMTRALRQEGCLENSIEFSIIGGMLPHREEDGDNDTSFLRQKEFITLKDKYNIQSVYFNHIKGATGSLSVVMTKDGAQWTTREDAFVLLSNSEEEDDRASESESCSFEESSAQEDAIERTSSKKRKRVDSFNDGNQEALAL